MLLTAILLSVASTPDSVVIYPSGAFVHRTATLRITGDTTVVFPDLPGGLDEASVRVKAPKGVRIKEIRVVRGYLKRPNKRIKALQDSLRALQDKMQSLKDEQDVLAAKEKYLSSIKVSGPKVASSELLQGKIDPQSWKSGLDFLATELARVKARKRQINQLIPDLQDSISALQTKINNERSLNQTKRSVEVDVKPLKAGRYRFELSYILPSGAGWAPSYELRAKPQLDKVEIVFNALIWQKTGEDWSNVKVCLSTTKPRRRQAPELEPWFVDIYQVRPPAPPKSAYNKAGEALAEEGIGTMETEAAPAPVETGVSLVYPIKDRITVKTGAEPRRVMVTGDEFPAEFEYYAYPRLDETAYLRGSFTNASDFHYLPGEALIYVGDEFTGKSYLPDFAPGEADTVSFGPDERIKVQRKAIKELKGKAGIFGSKRKVELGYRITVENYLKKGITLVVWDAIPLPRDKDIKVSGVKIRPKPDTEDKERQLRSWTLRLKALDKWEAEIRFAVEWPKDKQVSGLY